MRMRSPEATHRIAYDRVTADFALSANSRPKDAAWVETFAATR
jgi:hypothetical protein